MKGYGEGPIRSSTLLIESTPRLHSLSVRRGDVSDMIVNIAKLNAITANLRTFGGEIRINDTVR